MTRSVDLTRQTKEEKGNGMAFNLLEEEKEKLKAANQNFVSNKTILQNER
jgi:hypothetical protein